MTPSRPLNPREAWLIGYRISYENWCQWSPTLPIPEESRPPPAKEGDDDRDAYFYWSYYTEWKNSLPRRYQVKLPKVRYEWLGDNVFGAFIPLRWFEYTSDDQVDPEKPDYNDSICRERETDRAQLQHFLNFLERQGAPMDKDKISFGWMVDVDPRDDWRAY